MAFREWEAQQSLLHRHGNKKFTRLTPRTERESPVFEKCRNTDDALDLVILVGCASGLGVVIVALVAGLL